MRPLENCIFRLEFQGQPSEKPLRWLSFYLIPIHITLARRFSYDACGRVAVTTDKLGATTTYAYNAAGNLIKKAAPDGTTEYTYTAQNKLKTGKTEDGQNSTYTYNALDARIKNVQVRDNKNAGHANSDLKDGSHGTDYLDFLMDGRFFWQRTWETEVGTTFQSNFETVTKNYVVDYLSTANRDILVTEDGSFTQRYVYDENSTRISAEYGYAAGTKRGEGGENLQSDFAANDVRKVWYRASHLGSTLFAVDENGKVISHTIYDPWGNPLTETYTDTNFSGIDNSNNYTGYTWDEVLDLYFAQNRFYDAANHRFTQEDPIKDGENWYGYCGNNPCHHVDYDGLFRIQYNSAQQCGMPSGTYTTIVTEVQQWLVSMKYLNMGGAAYGIYGGLTVGAVAHFQFNYGFNITGVLDSATYLRIYNSYLRNVLHYSDKDAQKIYDQKKNSISKIDSALKTSAYYPAFMCKFAQHPAKSYAGMPNVTVTAKNGKYYMDYTPMINAVLNKHEPQFKVLSAQEYYKNFTNSQIANGTADYVKYCENRMIWFTKQVMEEGPWDLKLEASWNNMFHNNPPFYAQKYPFLYRGEVINAENLGNITYGYLGTSMGYSEKLLLQAGDIVSVVTGSGREDISDQNMVRRGIRYYKNK